MNKQLFIMQARKNGQLARQKAERVAVMLKMYHEDPANRQWLRHKAVLLSRRVAYHLRQAAILGQTIKALERKDKNNERKRRTIF